MNYSQEETLYHGLNIYGVKHKPNSSGLKIKQITNIYSARVCWLTSTNLDNKVRNNLKLITMLIMWLVCSTAATHSLNSDFTLQHLLKVFHFRSSLDTFMYWFKWVSRMLSPTPVWPAPHFPRNLIHCYLQTLTLSLSLIILFSSSLCHLFYVGSVTSYFCVRGDLLDPPTQPKHPLAVRALSATGRWAAGGGSPDGGSLFSSSSEEM